MNPIDIAKILTAATPIVASVVTATTKKSENEIVRKDNKENTINVTINNNFYITSEKDAMYATAKIQQQIIDSIDSSEPRYML